MEILNHIKFVSSFCVFSYVEHLRKVFLNNAGGGYAIWKEKRNSPDRTPKLFLH